MDALGDALVVFHQMLDQLQVAEHHHQQIVEIMGDAARQLAHGFHLLGLHELALQQLALGDALAGAENLVDMMMIVAVGLDFHFEVIEFALDQGLVADFEHRAVLAVLGHFDGFAEFLAVGGLDHLFEHREIRLDDRIVHADQGDHLGRET